jgi:plasmid stability protein
MSQILIRNLDPAVVDVLKRRASTNRRSLAEEVRRTLTAAAGLDRDAFLARIDALRAAKGPIDGPTALDDLHAIRDGALR